MYRVSEPMYHVTISDVSAGAADVPGASPTSITVTIRIRPSYKICFPTSVKKVDASLLHLVQSCHSVECADSHAILEGEQGVRAGSTPWRGSESGKGDGPSMGPRASECKPPIGCKPPRPSREVMHAPLDVDGRYVHERVAAHGDSIIRQGPHMVTHMHAWNERVFYT